MEKKEIYECSFCLKQFSTKGSLNIHQTTAKYCLEKQGKVSSIECNYCNKKFGSKQRLDEHLKSCKQYIDDIRNGHRQIKDLRESYERQIKDLKEQIKDLREMLDKSNNTIADIAKQPKNTTNIKTQNNTQNIHNILSDYKTYEENTNRDRILSLVNDEDIEEYFWKGQRGVAEFVCDRIAKTDDGKMIICCTDPTRSRFKYKNESEGISEDIDAHLFNKKISEPIMKIYNEVHSNIQKDIQEQLIVGSKEYSKTDLEYKKDIALEKNTEIQMISNPKENGEYRKTIAMHLKV
jgi:cell division septum initiation protein DivIVA